MIVSKSNYKFFSSLFFFALCVFPFGSWSQENPEEALQQLQQELKARQASLKKNRVTAEELQRVLMRSEKDIGDVARKLNNTGERLTENKANQAALTKRKQQILTQISQQQSLLANQLRSAFMAGNYDYAKMIFNQQDARKFERALTYYQYANDARKEQISGFKQKVSELESVNASLEEKAQALELLLQEQKNRQAELNARQNDRQLTLNKLRSKIRSEENEIASLREAEEALFQAIEDAKSNVDTVGELVGLSKLKGKLEKPATGRFRQLFGKRRQGQVKWKGIIIEGRVGSDIRAIAPGRVIYADWLKGFGLVSVVDHGEGYMSVYGHNQALLKQAGDIVNTGESIALLGQSGGQASPNLYFEIRHKGKVLNPSRWLNI